MKGQAVSVVDELSDGLLTCGAQGFHLLFESCCIRRAFKRVEDGAIRQADLLSAHVALRELGRLPDLDGKKAYVEELPRATADLLVFLYFRRLDLYLGERDRTYH